MRYWIYWNDLVQGPFEVSELLSLSAFTADLMVCEEDNPEWTPAAAVSELLPHLQTVAAADPGFAPLPPPEPPTLSPLQGEFFSEPSNQQHLFDLNGTKHYAFRPAEDANVVSELPAQFTSPFHFFSMNLMPPVETLPPPQIFPLPLPRTPEPEVHIIPESELGVLEPEETFVPEPPTFIPPPLEEPPLPEPKKEPVPEQTAPAVEPPAVIEPPPDIAKPAIVPFPKLMSQRIQHPPRRVVFPPPEPTALPERVVPPARETYEDDQEKIHLWPWMAGVAVVLASGVGLFLFMNRTPAPEPLPPPIVEEPVVESIPIVVEPPAPPPPVKIKKAVKAKPKPVPAVVIPVKVEELEPPAEKPVPTVEEIVPKTAPAPVDQEPVMKPSEPILKQAQEDGWRGKENTAIEAVMRQKIYAGKRTIGENAKLIMDQQHDKELLHAAETGERLYLPDKISWTALREEGPRYRVYLNFMAWQANGERVLARSAQFTINLQTGKVEPADDTARADFFDRRAIPTHAHSAKAEDIQTLLNGVDALNKIRMRAVILKSDKQKDEQKKTQSSLQAAEAKLQKQIVYFRTKYAEVTLQNVAKAFAFATLMKGK